MTTSHVVRISICFVGLSLVTSLALAEEPVNLLANGSFDEGVEGWEGRLVDRQRDNERIDRPDFVEHIVKEPDDEANGRDERRGVLQITLEDLGYVNPVAHQSGVHVRLTEPVPAGARLRIRFDARSLGGSNRLRITRAWGGSSYDRLPELTERWQRHEVILSLDFDTSHLIWSLVEGERGAARNRVAVGRCQIDNVHVSVIDEDDEHDHEDKGAG